MFSASSVCASRMQKKGSSSHFTQAFSLRLILFLLLFTLIAVAAAFNSSSPAVTSDGLSLLAFKSSADPGNKLHFLLKKRFDFCEWYGVKCDQGKVVRLVLEDLGLQGTFADNTLTNLDQLRVLSLKNNHLTGPIPNLSKLLNLKTLFLQHNSFTGRFPASILSLHRIRILDLSGNNLTGEIPTQLANLDRLYCLRLEQNLFNGTVPPLNQSSLRIFNVSGNKLAGPVPVTLALSSFNSSSFFGNPGLCGQIISRSCSSQNSPFFTFNQPPPQKQEQQQQPQQLVAAPAKNNKHKRANAIAGVVFGVSAVVLLVIVSTGFWVMAIRKKPEADAASDTDNTAVDEASLSVSEEKLKKMQSFQMGKSGTLIFCAGETQIYSLDELMRASAEMLGRGTIGTTYKAVLENQLIVSVKRLDAQNSSKVSKEMFETHMEMVGSLRHPNLIPLRAYFQAKEERLLVYDYQPNGSLFSLIHGSRSSRAKPLHWTSCLKIAEDVALGLAYIHQASRVFHGNLKSSNVLLGADFEACVTDYGLSVFQELDDNSGSGYRAPETRKSNRRLSAKSDVYSFGVLLIELITGKMPLESFLITMDLHSWVRSVREEEGGGSGAISNDEKLSMLLDIATVCVSASPDQRPTMRQALKMIQEVKETGEPNDSTGFTGS